MASKGFEQFQRDWRKNPKLICTITNEILVCVYGLTEGEMRDVMGARRACLGLTGRELEERATKSYFQLGAFFGRKTGF